MEVIASITTKMTVAAWRTSTPKQRYDYVKENPNSKFAAMHLSFGVQSGKTHHSMMKYRDKQAAYHERRGDILVRKYAEGESKHKEGVEHYGLAKKHLNLYRKHALAYSKESGISRSKIPNVGPHFEKNRYYVGPGRRTQ